MGPTPDGGGDPRPRAPAGGRPGHYFAPEPAAPSRPSEVALAVPGVALRLTTDRGVFSPGRVDPGTRLLLHEAGAPPDGEVLDLGCGYGPIAVAQAVRNPAARVWAVDVNRRALALCRHNSARAGAGNVAVAEPDDVPPDLRFAAVLSNPPVRIGKPALRALLGRWLDRLDPGATAWLVVHRQLGADALARWLDERGHPVVRVRSRQGYRVLAVGRRG